MSKIEAERAAEWRQIVDNLKTVGSAKIRERNGNVEPDLGEVTRLATGVGLVSSLEPVAFGVAQEMIAMERTERYRHDPPLAPAPTVRQACRDRHALDGADAQALEYALTLTEREVEQLKARVGEEMTRAERLRYEGEQQNMLLIAVEVELAQLTSEKQIPDSGGEPIPAPLLDQLQELHELVRARPERADDEQVQILQRRLNEARQELETFKKEVGEHIADAQHQVSGLVPRLGLHAPAALGLQERLRIVLAKVRA